MTWPREENRSTNKTPIFEIRLQGRLNEDWSDWLDGMSISHVGEISILKGQILDQAALRGILTRIWDLNRTVISVNQIQEL
jgi:hypothetical protein